MAKITPAHRSAEACLLLPYAHSIDVVHLVKNGVSHKQERTASSKLDRWRLDMAAKESGTAYGRKKIIISDL